MGETIDIKEVKSLTNLITLIDPNVVRSDAFYAAWELVKRCGYEGGKEIIINNS